jgi:hypothetical protein
VGHHGGSLDDRFVNFFLVFELADEDRTGEDLIVVYGCFLIAWFCCSCASLAMAIFDSWQLINFKKS